MIHKPVANICEADNSRDTKATIESTRQSHLISKNRRSSSSAGLGRWLTEQSASAPALRTWVRMPHNQCKCKAASICDPSPRWGSGDRQIPGALYPASLTTNLWALASVRNLISETESEWYRSTRECWPLASVCLHTGVCSCTEMCAHTQWLFGDKVTQEPHTYHNYSESVDYFVDRGTTRILLIFQLCLFAIMRKSISPRKLKEREIKVWF